MALLLGLAFGVATLGLHSSPAEAAELSKAERKALVKEAETYYSGTFWALKDIPANTGVSMGFPWLGPIAEVTPEGWEIDASGGMSATYGSAQSVWFGVRAYEKLQLKEVEYDEGILALTFIGVDGSKGRDTKIKCMEMTTFAELQPVLDQLVSTTDPVDPSWPDEIKEAIANRKLVNGMTKRQAYLVTGEPTSSSTTEEDGKKVEIWHPRQDNGMRIGMMMQLEATGLPAQIRFEDGVLVGIATGAGGGVSLD